MSFKKLFCSFLILMAPMLSIAKNNDGELKGTWKSICHNKSGVGSIISEYTFSAKKYRIQLYSYKDSLCKKPQNVTETTFEGLYSISELTITAQYSKMEVKGIDFIGITKDGRKIKSRGIYRVIDGKLFVGIPVPVSLCKKDNIITYTRGKSIDPYLTCGDRSHDLDFSYYFERNSTM